MKPLYFSCLCSRIHYVVDEPLLYAGYCHCSECRKFSGSSMSAFAGVRAQGVSMFKGEEQDLGCYWKSQTTRMRFCKHCGSSLYVEKLNAGVIHLRLGALDSQLPLLPHVHVFVESKPDWCTISDGLTQFKGAPPEEVASMLKRAVLAAEDDPGVEPERVLLEETTERTFRHCLTSPNTYAKQRSEGGTEWTDFYRRDSDRLIGACGYTKGKAPAFFVLHELAVAHEIAGGNAFRTIS